MSIWITAHNHAQRSPYNVHVSLHVIKKKFLEKHGYDQHIGRLNTNNAKDSTFH